MFAHEVIQMSSCTKLALTIMHCSKFICHLATIYIILFIVCMYIIIVIYVWMYLFRIDIIF